jgi:hypothetical protein
MGRKKEKALVLQQIDKIYVLTIIWKHYKLHLHHQIMNKIQIKLNFPNFTQWDRKQPTQKIVILH